jgi:TPR repeat protein
MKILLPCLYLTFAVLSPLIPIISQAGYAREAEIDSATPDLAFGAYQRGDFKVAMLEAKKRLQINPKDSVALALIGQLYIEGAGVNRDAKQAMDWFRRAADLGNAESAYIYGAALLQGLNVPKDRLRARDYLEKAAAVKHGSALHLLGEMALENEGKPSDFPRALDYFKRADAAGNADASYALGVLYKTGKGVDKDLNTAALYFKRAADLDLSAAMVEYAIMQFNGIGAPRDQQAAIALLRRAGMAGNVVAQNRLAHIYAEGLGIAPDLSQARYWRDKAREGGLADAGLDFLSSATGKDALDKQTLSAPTAPTQTKIQAPMPPTFQVPLKK